MRTIEARSVARFGAAGVAVVALAIGGTLTAQTAMAHVEYEHAKAVRLEQSLRLDASVAALDAAILDAEADIALAEAALAAAPVGHVGADAAAALEAARDTLAAALADAAASALTLPPEPAPPLAAGPLYSAAQELLDQAADAEAAAAAQEAAIQSLRAAEESFAEAGRGMLASAGAVASTVLAANPSVANRPHVEFLKVIDELAAAQEFDEAAVDLLARYVDRSNQVAASHAAEEAEKAGPLYWLRKEVEAYARSISGGVLLDFNWEPIVIGHSMAGTATIESSPPYLYSTITLTNSIAENWGATTPVALVTHEVGHAITSKCMDLFDAAFGGNYEIWATAWAMSWGQPAGPSGANSYGTPTPDQVAIAGNCR